MASDNHLYRLRRGVEFWNQFRPNENIDLSQANLKEAKLSKANLSKANLTGADLTCADLSEADLSQANLKEAKLSKANLSRANLTGADLISADLSNADLSQANISRVHLRGAHLRETNLREANLYKAILIDIDFTTADLNGADVFEAHIGLSTFGNNDLSEVKRLDTVQHAGPLIIGIDTIYRSKGNIPETFLRGAGVPDNFITYIGSLTEQAIEFYSCFISYSHADKSFARRLHDSLQGRGIRCWLDEHQLLPGDKIYTEVDRGIRLWDKVLLCCSKDALTSWWVDNEIKIAFEKEQHLWREREQEVLALIPLNLDDYLFSGKWQSGLATEVKARLAANFCGWEYDNKKFEEQFERLVRALRTDAGGKDPPPASQL
jgi:hypothetical protein